jgi:hypothetical protein
VPPIEDHPDYQLRHTEYVTQLAQAQAARDEVAEAKAENAWLKNQISLGNDLSAQQNAKAAHVAAVAALRAEFPQVPEAAYAHLSDIKAMNSLVKEIAPNFSPQDHSDPVNPGFTAPSGEGNLRKKVTNPFDDPAQANSIATEARKGNSDAQNRIKRHVFDTLIAPKIDKYGPAREKGMKKAGY